MSLFNLLETQEVPEKKGMIFVAFSGHALSMLVLTFLLCGLCLYYNVAIKKNKDVEYRKIPKLAFLMFLGIQWIRRLTFQILGKSYRAFVPFFIYIMAVLWFSNIISILGFESLGNTIVIPFTLTLVVFLGTVISGLYHRGRHYFGDYMVWIKFRGKRLLPIVDPLKLIGEMSKLVSLTCRLWGNTLAGSLILFVIYEFSTGLFGREVSYLGPMLIPLFVFPLHIYFDIIDGTVQPMIFMILSMCYWAMAKHGEGVQAPVGYDIEPEELIGDNVK